MTRGAAVTASRLSIRRAAASAVKNFEGLGQTRGAGNLLQLVVRPQEAVAAVQALAQAYADYYAAVRDYNRGQFRLYRAMGRPPLASLPRSVAVPVGVEVAPGGLATPDLANVPKVPCGPK